MKCEEFRTLLKNSDANALTEHLDGCPDCVRWLDGNLKKAPEGLLPGVFEEPPERVARHLPIPENPGMLSSESLRRNEASPNLRQPLGFAGLWKEVVAAFALGAVAAVIWMVVPLIQPQLPQINFHQEEFSFLEEKSNKIDPDFFDSEQIAVTEDHFEFSQKEKWSFLESENSYSFIEDEQEEKS